MQIDKPEIVSEVGAAFEAYEAALMANDTAALDALFWDHPAVIRYGVDEVAKGKAAISAFRRGRDTTDLTRRLTDVVITTYGDDFATAFCTYERTGSKRCGKQSQTWLRTPDGWRICAAHVSLAPAGSTPRAAGTMGT